MEGKFEVTLHIAVYCRKTQQLRPIGFCLHCCQYQSSETPPKMSKTGIPTEPIYCTFDKEASPHA